MTELFLDQSVGDQNSHRVGDASAALVDGLVFGDFRSYTMAKMVTTVMVAAMSVFE